jgi:hypothetical protein
MGKILTVDEKTTRDTSNNPALHVFTCMIPFYAFIQSTSADLILNTCSQGIHHVPITSEWLKAYKFWNVVDTKFPRKRN